MESSLGMGWFRFMMWMILIGVFLSTSCISASEPKMLSQETTDLPALFADTDSDTDSAPGAYVARSRFVTVNISLLMDENRIPRSLSTGEKVLLNLFLDKQFVGVLDRVEETSLNSYTWFGTLENIELSQVVIVYSDGVFIAHISSPQGVYEVKLVQDDLYQVIEIDQSKFPQD